MTNFTEDPTGEDIAGGGAGKIHIVQPFRDLQSNWTVDLSKNLEEYLLKICSGEISGDDSTYLSVNFAEAALLLQGSIQVYSRKVEYLYNLVLHALDFLSHKSQPDQPDSTSAQLEEGPSHASHDETDEVFWSLDDVPVEAKNCLDNTTAKDVSLDHFVKPPANLVVLEGDCLDTPGDCGELESYLLATSNLYQGFLLLDPCDAVAVQDFVKGEKAGKGQNDTHRGSSKKKKSFQSPTGRSGGSIRKSSVHRNQDQSLNPSPGVDCGFISNGFCAEPNPAIFNTPKSNPHHFDVDDGMAEPMDNSNDDGDDDDDPWKPLNPHELGNLKVKPFRKVKTSRRPLLSSTRPAPVLFPPAKLHGFISPELDEVWEKQCHAHKKQESEGLPLYEKLRQSLVLGGPESYDAFGYGENGNEDDVSGNVIHDFGESDFDAAGSVYMDEGVPIHNRKHDDPNAQFDSNEAFEPVDPNSHVNLEDLCRSHLDSILASIAETEQQTELATRVSTWKQNIEQNLEEQDSRPPFDIHDYGEKIIEKLSLEGDGENAMSFTDVVKGQQKHDVVRTFSALLQLVNNREVDLRRGRDDGKSTCYTATNPFYVRLLDCNKRKEAVAVQPRSSKKRVKSPSRRDCSKGSGKSPAPGSVSSKYASPELPPRPNRKFPVKPIGKSNDIKCTPEGKRRRRSQISSTTLIAK